MAMVDDDKKRNKASAVKTSGQQSSNKPSGSGLKSSSSQSSAAASSASDRVATVKKTIANAGASKAQSKKWYKGSEPTEAEVLAQIVKQGEYDDAGARENYSLYEKAKEEGHWKETYDKATSNYITALGLTPDQVTGDFFAQMVPYLEEGRKTNAGNQSTARRNSLASNIDALYADYQKTIVLESEQEQAIREAQYWIDKGLTDDEIKAKLNIGGENSKYTNLTKALQKTATGEYEPTTAPIMLLTSYGVDGMLWGLRNPELSKGDFKTDAIQAAMGRGSTYTASEEDIARRTRGSATWAPYSNGTTLDDEAIRFGVTEFSPDWFEKNRDAILASGDEDAIAAMGNVFAAESFTAEAEKEAADFRYEVDSMLESGLSPEEIFTDDFLAEYPSLQKMYDGYLTGQPVDVTRSVDFDIAGLKTYAQSEYDLRQAQKNAPKDPAAMQTAVDAEKQAQLEKNGDLLNTDTTPASITSRAPESVLSQNPQDSNRQGLLWACAPSTSDVAPPKGAGKLPDDYGNWTDAQKMAAQTYAADLKDGEDTEYAIEEMRLAGLTAEQIEAFKTSVAPQEEAPVVYTEQEVNEALAVGDIPVAVDMLQANFDQKIAENPELLTTDNAEKAAILTMVLANEAGILTDPEQQEKAKSITDTVQASMAISEDGGGLFGWIDKAFGGALSQTADNEGVGFGETVKYMLLMGGSKFNDVLANGVGTLMTGYGKVAEWTTKGLNAIGIKGSGVWAEKAQEKGTDIAAIPDQYIQEYEAYMRENATTVEYLAMTGGSEMVKMAGVGTMAQAASSLATGTQMLTTAMDAVKLETVSKLAAGGVFAGESSSAEFQETYAETGGNFLVSTLSAVATGLTTMATADIGILKNIEKSGQRFLPEIVDALNAVPGSGMIGTMARWGKAGLMYASNLLKTGFNEGFQEALENVVSTAATDSVQGKNLRERLSAEYGQELTRDFIMGFIGSMSSSLSVMPTYARSVIVAEQNMQKSALTAADVEAQMTAFVEDLNDPQVMENAATRAENLAVETHTGELVAQGAAGEVDMSGVDAAQERVSKAETTAAETATTLQVATDAALQANDALIQNPADASLLNDFKSTMQDRDKAEAENVKAQKELQEAQQELNKEQAAVSAQTDAAVAGVRAQAAAEVQQRKQEVEQQRADAALAADAQGQTTTTDPDSFIQPTENHTPEQRAEIQDMQKNSPANISQSETVTQTPHAGTSLGHNVQNENASPVDTSIAETATNVNSATQIPAPPTGMGVSQFAGQTGQNTPVLSDEVKQQLHDSPYYKKTNQKKNVDAAIALIDQEGYEARKNKLLDGTTDVMTPEGQAEAYVLAKAAKANGDLEGESAIAFRVKESGTTLGQAMAMRRLYVEMTPAGKARFVQRIVDQINRESRGKSVIEMPPWLEAELEKADGNDQQMDAVLDEAYRYIATQMRPSFADRINTWRYLAMLGNPLTHSKNLLANLAQVPYVMIKNKTAALGEVAVQGVRAAFGKETARTKSLRAIKQEYRDLAKQAFSEVESQLKGEPTSPMAKINDWRAKSWDWMDKASRFNSDLMSREDMLFKKSYFVNAMASYLQANNVDTSNPDAETMSSATEYAFNEAMKNTFNNANAFAEWLTSAQTDARKRGGAMKLADVAISAVMPFKKTPANVILRGVEYSPVGLLNAITTNTVKLIRGKDFSGRPYTVNQWVDSIASGLTGSMAVGMGAFLASIGVLDLGTDEDDELRGNQENSVNILGHNLSIDSFGSAAMPLLMGAKIYDLRSEEDNEDGMLARLLSVLGTIADPVMELSAMQGVNSLLSSASYSDNSLAAIGQRAGSSFLSQFVPSVFGAIARTVDDTRRTVYVDKNSPMDSQTQYFLQSLRNKIPGLSEGGVPYLDVWGDEVSNGSPVMRFLSNFLIPGYPKEQQDPDAVTQRLLDLFDETGNADFLPKEASKSFTADGEKYNLSAEEYQRYAKDRGDRAKAILESLFASDEFNGAADAYKLEAVEKVWEYSTKMAAHSINENYKVGSEMLNAEDPTEYVLNKMRGSIKADQQAEYTKGAVDAIAAGDLQSAEACVEGLRQTGMQDKSIKSKMTSQYKAQYRELYEAEDYDGMRDLEKSLILLGIGYKKSEFTKWLEEE